MEVHDNAELAMDTETDEQLDERIAYKDSTYEIVSKVAYLIGVPVRMFENEHDPPKLEVYERLSQDNLCSGIALRASSTSSFLRRGWYSKLVQKGFGHRSERLALRGLM